MDSTEAVAASPPDRAVRFVDIGRRPDRGDSWRPVTLVYRGHDQAGVIELDAATGYYRFVPMSWGLSAPVPGSFSVDVLKRQIAEWLGGREEGAARA